MAFEAGNLKLFGLDLRRGWEAFSQGWSDALRWPAFAWLSPQEAIRVTMQDGSVQWREGLSARPALAGRADAPHAVLLSDELVLIRQLRLPDLLRSDIEQALALQVEAHNPFAADDLVWGWRARPLEGGGQAVALAFSSRRQIDAWLAARGIVATDIEVWVDSAQPIRLQGYGHGLRERSVRRRRLATLAVLALLLTLVLLLVLTPFMMQRMRVFDAQRQQAILQAEAAPAVAARQTLVHSTAQLNAVREHLQTQADLPALFERLTQLFPDDAYLIRLEINGRQIRVAGFARNAAGLIEALGAHADFANVRTPTAISRSADGRESFTIDFTLRDDGGQA